MISKFEVELKGIKTLILHSCRTANPLDEYTKKIKAISSKRNKTDDDHIAMANLEFVAACYYHPEHGFYLPGANIEACLVNGAKTSKNGKKAVLAIRVPDEYVKLQMDHDAKDPQDLYDRFPETRDVRFVSVNRAKILRCRPRIERWGVKFIVELDESMMTISEFSEALSYAGQRACLGDCRPRYGQFEAKVKQLS